ncbi:hypothetical protein Mth01_56260 [Sphaerimonospora thailandensis]|uniref:Uncharacterized protein n=1 Tax=Sphaerimonospora thailandensis TaxID=795644 RepID=A0A8J3RE73_9ACTN|nr:hypothetical protein Mth01_56260 [Sphaerimonospora thailandensis]
MPDAIDTFVGELSKAWTAYKSWGYDIPGSYVSVYFGFDENDNPGLTLPFGDHIFDQLEGSVIILPSAPASDRYRYLAYHELFHVMQYYFIPKLNLITDLPSVNWWMEATAEWATHRMYNQTDPSASGWDIYSSASDIFLSEPQRALNSSTWPWEAHKRQYGAFILAQYLTEQTDSNFVLHSWESMGLTQLPMEVIKDVIEGYNLEVRNVLTGFWAANYRLAVDALDLSRFLGISVGYRDPHASTLWPVKLAGNRPARAVEQTLLQGGSANGSIRVSAGGASYLEFTGSSTDQSMLTLQVQEQDPHLRPMLDYLLVSWPVSSSRPSGTPSRWSRLAGDGEISVMLDPGEMGTLIVIRSDLIGGSGAADDSSVRIDWNASMVDGGTRPNSALNNLWSTQEAAAGCADWSGGDGVQSTLLPGGKRAWFFSDTFLGDPSKRSPGTEVSYIRNSIVLQGGSSLRTITGGSTCGENDSGKDFWDRYAKTPVGEGGQYWTGDAKVSIANGTSDVVKFYYEGIGDENTRAAYVRFPQTDLTTRTTMSVSPTKLQDCSARPPYPIIWGASLLDHEGMTYIYGWEADGTSAEKPLYLARTASTVDPADQSQWRYFSGTAADGSAQWTSSCAASKPLQSKSEVDFSVIHLNGRFWLVHHTPASEAPGKIVAVPATTAWGFGSDQVDLFTPPETKTNPNHSSVYGARVHADVNSDKGRIVISYTVSTSAINLTCWTRGYYFPDNYQPRFIDVPTTAFFSAKT